LGAPPEPDSVTTATAAAPVVTAPVRRIVAPLSFEPYHDDITGIIDALAAMPPPSAIDTLEDVDKSDIVPAPVLPVIFVSDSDDTNQPTDVEPEDASPVVSQASAMSDAHQSVIIISSVAYTTSFVPVVTESSSFTPPRVVRGRINKNHVVVRRRAHHRQAWILDAKTSYPSSSQISRLLCGHQYAQPSVMSIWQNTWTWCTGAVCTTRA